jgi:hypothetical protein
MKPAGKVRCNIIPIGRSYGCVSQHFFDCVALVEWDSVDDALAFYKSKAWTDLAPQRDKSQKTIRRYVVEVEKSAVSYWHDWRAQGQQPGAPRCPARRTKRRAGALTRSAPCLICQWLRPNRARPFLARAS